MSSQTENTTVEAAEDDDEDYTLGQFREKTKDLPDSTPVLISAIVPTEPDEDADDTEEDDDDDSSAVESADGEDDDEDVTEVTAPVLGVEIEDYTIAGENGAPDKTIKAVTIVMHVDDLSDDEDDEEGDEPVDNG